MGSLGGASLNSSAVKTSLQCGQEGEREEQEVFSNLH